MTPERSSTTEMLSKLERHQDLTEGEAAGLARELVEGHLPADRTAKLLVALAEKGETSDELVGFAKVLRERCLKFPGPREAGALDLCGTGGSRRPTFNISTVSAFVVAACGQPVAKHGNVSARGPCGSTDLLTALGLPSERSIRFAEESWRRERLTFLHAPLYHTATKAVASVRKQLGGRTIFNQLGPLTNPAEVKVQLVGAYSDDYARRAGPALSRLGVERALFVHAEGEMDEFSSLGPTIVRAFGGTIPSDGITILIDPDPMLHPEERKGDLSPRPPPQAAELALRVLEGKGDGAVRGAVLLTSAAALWASDEQMPLSGGVERARQAILSGAALAKLRALQELAQQEEWAS
jgi:anthranilate phosphoribosyltransferase